MRRLLLLFLLIICSVAGGFAQNETMFIYRNDGVIDAFLKEDIDSMRYSKLDTDSLLHENFVVQEVWTADTVHRIPLAVVDSIGFNTPSTVYKSGVFVLEGAVRQHIIGLEGSTLRFSLSTPMSLLPKKGDKVASTIFDDYLQRLFVGQVASVRRTAEAIEVECDAVALNDVFVRYYGLVRGGEDYSASAARAARIRQGGGGTFTHERIPLHLCSNQGWPFGVSLSADDFSIGVGVDDYDFTLGFTPTIKYYAYSIVELGYPVNFGVQIDGFYNVDEKLVFAGQLSGELEKKIFNKGIYIPYTIFDLNLEFGFFLRGNPLIAAEFSAQQYYASNFRWTWTSKDWNTPNCINRFYPVGNFQNGYADLNGQIQTGFFAKVGVAPAATAMLDLAELNLRFEGGLQLQGSSLIRKSDYERAKHDTDIYDNMRNEKGGLYWYYGTSAEAQLSKWAGSLQIPNLGGIPFNNKGPILTYDIVPGFSDISLTLSGRSLQGNCVANGRTRSLSIGLVCFPDGDTDRGNFHVTNSSYRGPVSNMSASFPLTGDLRYSLHPFVQYRDLLMLASPSAYYELPITVPTIKGFRQTGSRYAEGAFRNNEKTYNYKYDGVVTVEIESDEAVSDWGYAYEDPDGNVAFISLMGRTSPVDDSNYAYYRNSSIASVRFYGYCVPLGSKEPITGPVREFPLIHNMAVASTGDNSNITETSATVVCSYSNVPQGARCGVEYTTNPESDGNWAQKEAGSGDGTQHISLSGLKPGTKYYYRAYINDSGQMYRGGVQDFTTLPELPDLTGTWTCTIHFEDKDFDFTITLNADGSATQTGSDRIPEDERGSWSVSSDSSAHIGFVWGAGGWANPIWMVEEYSGKVNSLTNPSYISGRVFRGYTGNQGGTYGSNYDFEMSR